MREIRKGLILGTAMLGGPGVLLFGYMAWHGGVVGVFGLVVCGFCAWLNGNMFAIEAHIHYLKEMMKWIGSRRASRTSSTSSVAEPSTFSK
jgi:hypothetical protein